MREILGLREAADTPLLVIHSRALSRRGRGELKHANALISKIETPSSQGVTDTLVSPVLEQLALEGISYRFVEGDQDAAGYEIASVAQSLYINATRNKGFVALWLSPSARSVYRQQGLNRQELLRFAAVGIQTREADLYDYLTGLDYSASPAPLPSMLQQQLSRYLESENVVALSGLVNDWPEYRWQRLIDLNSRQSFLIGLQREAGLRLIANLNPRDVRSVFIADKELLSRSDIQGFIDSRMALLTWESAL